MRRWLIAFVMIASVREVGAQTASAEAEKLFRDGKTLIAAGRIGEACEAFEGSWRKDPVVSTLLNLADCRERNRQYASAWGHFLEAARRSADQPAFRETAHERAQRLEARLSYLIINVPDGSRIEGLTITRNDVPVDVAEWNRDMPVDGGRYTIKGKAPGYEPWWTTVTVGESGDKQSVNVPRFQEATAPHVEAAGGSRFTTRRKAAIGAWAVGAIGLGAGLALELTARGTYDDAKAAMDNATRRERYDAANRERLIGTVVAGVGVAAVAAGVVLWVTGTPASREGVAIVPIVGGDAAGIALGGRY